MSAGGIEQPGRASRKDEHLNLAVRLHGTDRPNAFIEKHSANSLAWVMGILGFLLAADALGTLLK